MMPPERRLSKAYFEITNVCNARCSFCPGTTRKKRFVTHEEFLTVLSKLKGQVEYLYFHLMGEPLLHPDIVEFARIASTQGFRVMITTNGILADTVGRELIDTGAVFKISLSLHSFEANAYGMSLGEYLDGCFSLSERAAERGTICVFRLWNRSKEPVGNCRNEEILSALKTRFGGEWVKNRSGYRLSENIFLEWGDRFVWPGHAEVSEQKLFCYALRSQIGILCDGTVVPCCLDSEGKMALGNLFSASLEEILSSERAVRLYDGFTASTPTESLCRTCGFARRFSVK